MRKRRYAGSLSEALQGLRSQLTAAHTIQQRFPAATAPGLPVPPPVPSGIASLTNLNTLGEIPDEVLEALRLEIVAAREKTAIEAREWENLQKHLKSAMDTALMVTALKADLGVQPNLKRRRTNSVEEVNVKSEVSLESDSANESPMVDEFTSADASVPTSPPSLHPHSRHRSPQNIQVGRQVAFKLPQTQLDEWIQCEITKVFPGGQRFEVRDPEPDDMGNPGKTYQCRLKDIIPLPVPGQPIKPLPSGSIVLALYPETTAFYKARIASYSAKRNAYFLRFEGEEDAHKEIEVRENYVLPTRARKS